MSVENAYGNGTCVHDKNIYASFEPLEANGKR